MLQLFQNQQTKMTLGYLEKMLCGKALAERSVPDQRDQDELHRSEYSNYP